MARTDRKIIRSGAGGKGKWSDEQRIVLDLCYRLWDLDDHQVNALFHRVYPDMKKGLRRDYKYDHTRDEWKYRHNEGRYLGWRTLSRPNEYDDTEYDNTELEERERVKAMVEAAAAGGGLGREAIPLVRLEYDPAVVDLLNARAKEAIEGDGETVAQEDDADGTEEQATPVQPRRSDRSKRKTTDDRDETVSEPVTNRRKTASSRAYGGLSAPPVNFTSTNATHGATHSFGNSSAADVASKPSSPANVAASTGTSANATGASHGNLSDDTVRNLDAPPEPEMVMVHFKDLEWDRYGGLRANDEEPDVAKTDKTYQFGGQVHYINFGGGWYGHAMVCNTDVCGECNITTRPSHAGKYRGKPFVHCGPGGAVDHYDESRDVYVLKTSGLRLHDNKVHKHFKPAMISFNSPGDVSDGKPARGHVRSAWVCDPESCPTCKNYPLDLDEKTVAEQMSETMRKMKEAREMKEARKKTK